MTKGQEMKQEKQEKVHFHEVCVEICPICRKALKCTRTVKVLEGLSKQDLSCREHGVIGWRYKRLRSWTEQMDEKQD